MSDISGRKKKKKKLILITYLEYLKSYDKIKKNIYDKMVGMYAHN